MKIAALPFPVILVFVSGIASAQGASEATPQLRGWVVSETTSPVDYSPIASATIASRQGSAAMQLAIRCRSGRTELAVTGTAFTGRGDNYAISYRVNGGQPMQVAGIAATFGDGVAFRGDVVALLRSLPNDAELAVRLKPLSGNELDAIFPLNGLETLRARIGGTCKWPHDIAKPNDRQSSYGILGRRGR